MSGAATVAAVAAAVGTTYSIYSGEQNKKRQEEGANMARKQAEDAATAQDQAMNKANPKRPDVFGIMAKNASLGQNGVGSTNLTGTAGVDPNAMLLGKSSLLGF